MSMFHHLARQGLRWETLAGMIRSRKPMLFGLMFFQRLLVIWSWVTIPVLSYHGGMQFGIMSWLKGLWLTRNMFMKQECIYVLLVLWPPRTNLLGKFWDLREPVGYQWWIWEKSSDSAIARCLTAHFPMSTGLRQPIITPNWLRWSLKVPFWHWRERVDFALILQTVLISTNNRNHRFSKLQSRFVYEDIELDDFSWILLWRWMFETLLSPDS